MALKGTTKIELTNVKTGEREVIEKDNLVTNALADVLSLDPFAQNRFTTRPDYMTAETSFPICPNMVGGILLYEDVLEENADNYYAASNNNLVGYSSNNVNETDDPRRGSMNQTESGPLEDGSGYRFVFDFATSQANGTISGVGLTSKWGGVEGYGAEQSYKYGAGTERVKKSGSAESIYTDYFYRMLFNSICMIDGDKNVGYAAMLTGDNTITTAKIRLNITNISLVGNRANQSIIEENVIITDIFGKFDEKNTYIAFVNDGEGYIWGLQYENNKSNVSSGDAVINWVKINPIDWSFSEGSWTFSLPLYILGYQHLYNGNANYKTSHVIIHEKHLYVFSYDKTTIYRINLDNITDVTAIKFEDGSDMWGDYTSYRAQSCTFNLVGNVIIFGGGYIIGDKAVKAYASHNNASSTDAAGIASCGSPALKWKCFLFTTYKNTYSESNSSIKACLMSPYLATINNLPTPVQKTADKTMKITYILREES